MVQPLSPEEIELQAEIRALEHEYALALDEEEKRLRLELARTGIIPFTEYTYPEFDTSWHHDLMGKYLDDFLFGDLDRLLISVPPRHGKSELVSRRLPPFIFGHNPDAKILCASYASDLAESMNRDVQQIMDTPAYQELFPNSRLRRLIGATKDEKEIRTLTEFQLVGRRGHYRGVGVGGALTGFGGHYGIIDDPFKNREQADSATYRESVWRWYQSTFYTRLELPRKICLVFTRWHEDDLAGRLLELAKANSKADQWVEVRLPAVADDDLHPEDKRPRGSGAGLWPVKFPQEVYESIRITVGGREWSALYQGRPSPPKGKLFKREFWKFYKLRKHAPNASEDVLLPTEWDEQLISVDARFTSKADDGDYVVMQVWARKGAQKYILDQTRERLGFTESVAELKRLARLYPQAVAKLVENKANGPAIENQLKSEVSGIILVEPQGDKVARANSILPTVEAGNVWLPSPEMEGFEWVDEFIREHSDFPKVKHDDQVDATTQALLRFLNNESTLSDFGALAML